MCVRVNIPSILPSILPSFLPSFLPSSLPFFLPSFLSISLSLCLCLFVRHTNLCAHARVHQRSALFGQSALQHPHRRQLSLARDVTHAQSGKRRTACSRTHTAGTLTNANTHTHTHARKNEKEQTDQQQPPSIKNEATRNHSLSGRKKHTEAKDKEDNDDCHGCNASAKVVCAARRVAPQRVCIAACVQVVWVAALRVRALAIIQHPTF